MMPRKPKFILVDVKQNPRVRAVAKYAAAGLLKDPLVMFFHVKPPKQ